MDIPAFTELTPQPGFPDPLRRNDGSAVTTPLQWRQRRTELLELFQHFMYGYLPSVPPAVTVETLFSDASWRNGLGTLREVAIRFHAQAPPLHLLVATPNLRAGPVPLLVGPNFGGNHTEVDDPRVAIPTSWMPEHIAGVVGNQATEAGRGKRCKFDFDQALRRGYGIATFYHGDIDPDRPDFTDGIHPFVQPEPRGEHAMGTIAAWAWGVMRAVDHLVADPTVDPRRIGVVGHSRNGKVALLAAAVDERIALACVHQAGMGGSAPSRGVIGESIKAINERFPHWFCDMFKRFNEQPELLPFDQHALVGLCAPRPVLFSNAVEDGWANPAGQLAVLREASPVYRLLGVPVCPVDVMPLANTETVLADTKLGFFYRPGKHDMLPSDWKAFLDFSDRWL
ncbi:MAG: acetylxylan esterase [Planctomycetota bacterium]